MPLILPNTIANEIPADGDKLDQNFDTIVDWANQNAITADGSTGMQAPLLLPGKPTQPNQAASKQYVDDSVPLGIMQMFGGDVAPTNWMLCRGAAISRATYSGLFAVIGTRFGAGDGSTTFNLPDMNGQYVIGYNATGAYFSVGVGERFGSKDAPRVQHTHNGADHLHSVGSLGTAGENANHDHGLTSIEGPAGGAVGAFGYGRVGVWDGNPRIATGPERQAHAHQVIGTVGAADRTLTTTGVLEGGVSPSNANLPPSVSFNFIMKVL